MGLWAVTGSWSSLNVCILFLENVSGREKKHVKMPIEGNLLPVIPQKLSLRCEQAGESIICELLYSTPCSLFNCFNISCNCLYCSWFASRAKKKNINKTKTKQLVWTNRPTSCSRGREWPVKSAALVLDGNEQILHSNMAQGRISQQFTYLSINRWLKVHFTHAAVSQSFKKNP